MEFLELLDFETSKLWELILRLSSTEKNIKLEELACDLLMDKKTIIRYLRKLENMFEKAKLNDYLTIVFCAKNELSLKKESELFLENFLVYFFEHIPELYFLGYAVRGEQMTVKGLAQELCISESNLRKRMKKINDWLKKINIHLKHGTYELLGDEEQIRILTYHYYQFVFRGTIKHFLLKDRQISLLVTFNVSFFKLQINEIQKESLARMIEIILFRYEKNCKINIRPHWKQYTVQNTQFLNYLKQLKEQLFFNRLNLAEFMYLYLFIQSVFSPYFHRKIQTHMIQEHYQKRTSCYQHTLLSANKFKQIFFEKKFVLPKEQMVSLLGFHLYYELFSQIDWIECSNNKENIAKQYPKFNEKMQQCVVELIKEETIYERIPFNSLFSRYFQILTATLSPTYNEKKIMISLMTDFSIEEEINLGEKISMYFYKKYNIVLTYARKTVSILYSDIILTTVVHQSLAEKYTEKIVLLHTKDSKIYLDQIEKKIKQVL